MVFGRVWADLSGALRLRWSFLAAPLRCAAACGARKDVWGLFLTADLKVCSTPYRPTIWSLGLHLV